MEAGSATKTQEQQDAELAAALQAAQSAQSDEDASLAAVREKKPFLEFIYNRSIDLPRQAWDKHRKVVGKERGRFVYAGVAAGDGNRARQGRAAARGGREPPPRCVKNVVCVGEHRFHAKNDHFAKTGSGQTQEMLREKRSPRFVQVATRARWTASHASASI